MDELYKCGYCGFLLNSQCEDLLEHQCLKDIFIEGEHDLMEDDRKVLTIVEKATGDTVGSQANTSFEEQLIKYIQERPALYNPGLPLLDRTHSKKMALWGEIANLFGGKYAVVDLQKKWKYLRDCYTRAKKKVKEYKPSGSEATAPPNPGFSYYELLKFIDDGASSQSVLSAPMQNPAASPLPSTSGANSQVVTPITSPVNEVPVVPTLPTPSAKRMKTDGKTELQRQILSTLTTSDKSDGVDGFLLRLGESLRRLPYRKRCQVEIKIMQLVYETEHNM